MTPLHLKDGHLFIDNSSINEFITCPRSAEYKLGHKRILDQPRSALFFGGALHAALEVRYNKGQMITPTLEGDMLCTLGDYFTGYLPSENDYRTLPYATEVIREYNKTYKFESFKPLEFHDPSIDATRKAVEVPFALPLGELTINADLLTIDPDHNNGEPTVRHITTLPIIFTGRIDVLAEYRGDTILIDHKSTSMGGSGYFEEFYTSMQFKGYKWAAEQILGQRISGVMINALVCRKPLMKAPGKFNGEFLRDVIHIPDSNVVEWRDSMLHTISDFLNCHVRDYFPLHTAWCKGKYGKCPYYNICTSPAGDGRLQLLYSPLYTDDTWSPLHTDDQPKPKAPTPLPDISAILS